MNSPQLFIKPKIYFRQGDSRPRTRNIAGPAAAINLSKIVLFGKTGIARILRSIYTCLSNNYVDESHKSVSRFASFEERLARNADFAAAKKVNGRGRGNSTAVVHNSDALINVNR